MSELVVARLADIVDALPAYEIGTEIGRGAGGVVYGARHRALGRDVAIKLLPVTDPRARRRFAAEARMLASLDHPNIVRVHDFVERDGVCALVMERVEGGGTLHDALRAGMEPQDALAVGLAVCSALAHAHARGVLHRDIKPANVLVGEGGAVKVVDFGVAAMAGRTAGRRGELTGTPAYMAPELAAGADRADAGTDVYALAVLLYEALAGRLPHRSRATAAETLRERASRDPEPLDHAAPDTPRSIVNAVMHSLARDPSARPRSAAAFERSLASAAARAWGPRWSQAGVAAARTRVADTLHPAGARRRRGLALGAIAVAAAAAVALVVSDIDPTAQDEGTASASAAAPLSVARVAPATTAVGNSVVLAGGLVERPDGSLEVTDSVRRYDTVLRAYSDGPPLPIPLHHAMAVAFRGRTVVLGGWTATGGDLVAEVSRAVFGRTDDGWEELPPMPRGRAAAAAAVVGDRIVVAGGRAQRGPGRTTYVFDGRRWERAEAIPTPRARLAGAADDRFLYAIGGRDRLTGAGVQTVERYDPQQDAWESLPDLPTGRHGLGAALQADRVVALGGETGTRVSGAVHAYDPEADRWEELPRLARPRHSMAVATVLGRLHVLGGAGGVDTNTPLKSTEIISG